MSAANVGLARRIAKALARSLPRRGEQGVLRLLARLEPAEQRALLRALENLPDDEIAKGLRVALKRRPDLRGARNAFLILEELSTHLGSPPPVSVIEGVLKVARDPRVDAALPQLLKELAAGRPRATQDFFRAVSRLPEEAFSRRAVDGRITELLRALNDHPGAARFLRIHGWEDRFRTLLEWCEYDVEWLEKHGLPLVQHLTGPPHRYSVQDVVRDLAARKAPITRLADDFLRARGATAAVGQPAITAACRRRRLKAFLEAIEGWQNGDRGNAFEEWLRRWIYADPRPGPEWRRLRFEQAAQGAGFEFPSGYDLQISDRVVKLEKIGQPNRYRAVIIDAKLYAERSSLDGGQFDDYGYLIDMARTRGLNVVSPDTQASIVIDDLKVSYVHQSKARAQRSMASMARRAASPGTTDITFSYVDDALGAPRVVTLP